MWSDDQNLKDARTDERRDFQEEFLWDLWKTYNPDVEKWHKDLVEEMKQTMKNYEWFWSVKDYDNIIQEHQLNNLKAKIEELDKYSYDDITRTIDWSNTDVFMQAVKPRIEELQAQWVENTVTNLVAISNMDVENFEKQMKNFKGKSPMPSIAVMDVNVPHEAFWDLTLVFGRDTIDPKVDERNKIYGSDAWTPTFPTVDTVVQDVDAPKLAKQLLPEVWKNNKFKDLSENIQDYLELVHWDIR